MLIRPLMFLIDTAIEIYLTIIILRFLLQYFRADFHNPMSQFTVKATSIFLRPMRRVIPGWRGIDFSSLLLAFLVQLGGTALLLYISGNVAFITAFSLPISALISVIDQIFVVFLFAIFIRVIISWVAQSGSYYTSSLTVIYALTDPILRPFRRIAVFGVMDFTPFIAVIAIIVTRMVIEGLHFKLVQFPISLAYG